RYGLVVFFFSSRRRHTRFSRDWSSDVALPISNLGLSAFTVTTVGLIVGGVLAAPLGAIAARHVRPRFLLLAVAIVLVATSVYSRAEERRGGNEGRSRWVRRRGTKTVK